MPPILTLAAAFAPFETEMRVRGFSDDHMDAIRFAFYWGATATFSIEAASLEALGAKRGEVLTPEALERHANVLTALGDEVKNILDPAWPYTSPAPESSRPE